MNNQDKRAKVAYFCMEYGLHENFNIYAGGLGILAGDILKAAEDLQMPMVGIGILWRQGYLTQTFNENGIPVDSFQEYRYDFLKDTNVSVNVRIRGRQVKCKIWKCTEFGNVPLYLLDANLKENADRLLTGQLYGWFSEERVAQEIILSIGGIRALRALDIDVDIYHFNDSHPVPAGIEIIREEMDNNNLSFEEALNNTREKIVFTTHTPVIAGNEVHEHDLLKYMGMYNGLTYGQMLKIGGEPFSMTEAGLRLSKKANAVSKLHCNTARKMWSHVKNGSEIIPITNGVHNGTWQDSKIIEAYNSKNGLLNVHNELKKSLVDKVFELNNVKLNENKLIIGFARRAAEYKRSDLIFSDESIIGPLLEKGDVQIIFSGKAHPNDLSGKGIIKKLYKMSKNYKNSIVFLENYNMEIGKILTRGVDVWLNNPIRPMEASGTSGMKAAMNGVLNFSILDGWWPEGCEHGVNGWQFGNGYEGENHLENDSKLLYNVLINEVLSTYNNKKLWEKMMYESIKMSIEKFSASRMVNEYYELMYI
ncbi:MAG: alpha-glucan family phosphorylase [Clostridiales bacterium]